MVGLSRRGVLLSAIVIGVAVGVASVGIVWAFTPHPGPDCTPSPGVNFPSPRTLALGTCPSTTLVEGHSYYAIGVPLLSDGQILGGQFQVNQTVIAYLLDGPQMAALQHQSNVTSPLPGYVWSSGNVTQETLSQQTLTSPATTFFAIVNLHSFAVNVSWTQTLTLFYKSTTSSTPGVPAMAQRPTEA